MLEAQEITNSVDKLVRDILKLKTEEDYFQYLRLRKELECKLLEIREIEEKIKQLLDEE